MPSQKDNRSPVAPLSPHDGIRRNWAKSLYYIGLGFASLVPVAAVWGADGWMRVDLDRFFHRALAPSDSFMVFIRLLDPKWLILYLVAVLMISLLTYRKNWLAGYAAIVLMLDLAACWWLFKLAVYFAPSFDRGIWSYFD